MSKISAKDKAWLDELRERMRGHLIALMDEFQMNSAQFAKASGLSTGTLSNLISGKKPMGLSALAKIRRAFPSVSANVWMDKEPEPGHVPTGRTGVPVRQPTFAGPEQRSEGGNPRSTQAKDSPPRRAAHRQGSSR